MLAVLSTVLSDGARVLTLVAIAAVADAIARRATADAATDTAEVVDIASPFALHYSGTAAGPGKAFGFDLGDFRTQSESMRFHDARLLGVRCEVLDKWLWRGPPPRDHGVSHHLTDPPSCCDRHRCSTTLRASTGCSTAAATAAPMATQSSASRAR